MALEFHPVGFYSLSAFSTEILILSTLIWQPGWGFIQNLYFCWFCCLIYPDYKHSIGIHTNVIYFTVYFAFSLPVFYELPYWPFVIMMIHTRNRSISLAQLWYFFRCIPVLFADVFLLTMWFYNFSALVGYYFNSRTVSSYIIYSILYLHEQRYIFFLQNNFKIISQPCMM